jgi:two-component system response regulator
MTEKITLKPIDILIVEDNGGDLRLIREVLDESKISNQIYAVRDGEEALDFLFRRGKYSNVSLPDLIILDLNLPKIDGREVLAEIKVDPTLKKIPVVVMTMSQSDEDILKVYSLHANCFITKPIDLDQFIKVVKSIEDFWLTIVKLPPKNA